MPKTKNGVVITLLILLSFILFLINIRVGSVDIPLKEFLTTLFSMNTNSVWYTTIFEFRLPKAIVAVLAGAALSVSGLQMQTLFRNPLAGPYILGISAGAGLGVALLVMGLSGVMAVSIAGFLGQWAIAAAAWVGAAFLLMIVMVISVKIRDIMTILVFGIMFGSAASALVSIIQYFSDETALKSFVIWTLGSLGGVTKTQMGVFVPGILAGLIIALILPKKLNALLLGENYARTMGLNIQTTRVMIFISTSLLAGTVTAFCGPIGFIGIAVPHICRMLLHTANHHILLPVSMLLGANVMLLSDIISQLPGHSNILPINSITALIGIPVVIWIVVKNQKLSSVF